MPSKNLLMRLSRRPFVPPTKTMLGLSDELLWDFDTLRQKIGMSTQDEQGYWCQQADSFLELAQTPAAKKYVWSQLSSSFAALHEPDLFMANCRWLSQHREWAPRGARALEWLDHSDDSVESLMAASSRLPDPAAILHLQTWLCSLQHELNAPGDGPRLLPVQKMRQNADEDGIYNQETRGHSNSVLWRYVVLPMMEHLQENDALVVPYLPFHGEHSFTEQLLTASPPTKYPWILQNALSIGDLFPVRGTLMDERQIQQIVSRWAATLSDQQLKSFMAWDLLHRQEHASLGSDIVKLYCPDVHAMLDSLGMLQMPAMRKAVLLEWHTTTNSPDSLPLPEGILTDMDPT